MNWENELHTVLSVLGDKPNQSQLDSLESWIKAHVPTAYWGNIAVYLPYDLMTDFRMYAAELGEI